MSSLTRPAVWAAAMLVLLCAAPAAFGNDRTIRFATFNASVNRNAD